MILRRLILSAIVVAGLVVSGLVAVGGLIHALYALLAPRLGVAGATAVMVGVVAIVLGAASAVLFAISRAKKAAPQPAATPISDLVETVSQTVRDRPGVMLLAAVGAGVLAIQNPRYLATALRALATPRVVED